MFKQGSSIWHTTLWVFFALAAGYGLITFFLPSQNKLPSTKTLETNQAKKESTPTTAAENSTPPLQYETRTAMGTKVDLTIVSSDEKKAKNTLKKCFQEIDRLDALLTTWTKESEVSQINDAAGKHPVSISDDTIEVLQAALLASARTEGLFDVTVGAFAGVWKFDQDRDNTLPSKEEVAKRLPLVGYQGLLVDPIAKTAFLKRPGMRITLGGIGKGFAVDRCAALFRADNFQNFLIQAGGDLYVGGKRGNQPWKIGIRDPRGKEEDTFAVFEISDRAFSTSGDYERFIIKDGIRYHHILDPRTGYPAKASMSVTVSAKDATTAEGLSKALFILGPEKSEKRIKQGDFSEIATVIVSQDGTIYLSPSLQDGSLGRMIEFYPPTLSP